VVPVSSVVKSSCFSSSRGESSEFSVLHCGSGDPINSRISPYCLVGWVHQNNFVKFECGILIDPVGIQNSEIGSTSSNSLLSDGFQIPFGFELINTLTLWLSIHNSLPHRSLPASSPHTNAKDHVALFGFVSKSTRLVWTRRTCGPVDCRQLPIFPATNSEKETKNIGLFPLVELFHIFVGNSLQFIEPLALLVQIRHVDWATKPSKDM